jgi:disulfide bond formation protein DsbB
MSNTSGTAKRKAIFGALSAGALGFMMLAIAYVSQLFGFEPCTICVEIRFFLSIGVITSLLTALILAISHSVGNFFQCWAPLIYGYAAYHSIKLVLLERGIIFDGGCTPFTFYHKWIALHEWWPAMFQPQGLCGQPAHLLPWLTYAQASAFGLTILTIMTLSSTMNRKKMMRYRDRQCNN